MSKINSSYINFCHNVWHSPSTFYLGVYAYVCFQVCIDAIVNAWCFLQLLTILYLTQDLSLGLEFIHSASLTIKKAPRVPTVFISTELGIQKPICYAKDLRWILRIKFSSLLLHSKILLTAISAASNFSSQVAI